MRIKNLLNIVFFIIAPKDKSECPNTFFHARLRSLARNQVFLFVFLILSNLFNKDKEYHQK